MLAVIGFLFWLALSVYATFALVVGYFISSAFGAIHSRMERAFIIVVLLLLAVNWYFLLGNISISLEVS